MKKKKTTRHLTMITIVCILPSYTYPECIRDRSGLHRVHGGRDFDAGLSGVGCALLHHALQPGALLHVWEPGRGSCPSA